MNNHAVGSILWTIDRPDSNLPYIRVASYTLGMQGMATLEVVEGDLLDQPVEVIVNAWNRNLIPWWLLLPQGVSGAIKIRGGYAPFRELGRLGPIPLGGAVITGPGRLPFRAIIHVAGISLFWVSSEKSVRACTANALKLAAEQGYASIALPLIGAGTGGGSPEDVEAYMRDEVAKSTYPGGVRIVRFRRVGGCP